MSDRSGADESLPSNLSTQVYVERWRDGDPQALGRLASRLEAALAHRIRCHKLFAALSRDASIDDLTQEVWTRLFATGADAYTHRGKGSFLAWLGSLADSTLTDLYRRKEAKKRGAGKNPGALNTRAERDARAMPGATPQQTPSQVAQLHEFERVARTVLTERELKVWTWTFLLGYTSEETAFGLSTTSSAVRGVLLRSKSKMEDALRKHRGDPG